MAPDRRLLTLAALPLALLLSGCPYESPEPLTPPGEGVFDARLFGPWTCRLDDDEKDVRVTFLAFDAHQYVLLWEQPGEPATVARAHRGVLAGVPFLSFQFPEPPDRPDERTWSFARYGLEGDGLSLTAVKSEAFPKGSLPVDVKTALERRGSDPALYEPLAECRRVTDGK